MTPTQFFINGYEHRPKNADSIGFRLDFTGAWREAELSVDSIILEGKERDMVMEHLQTLGPFEGIPYTIKIGSLVLEYYIDLTQSPKIKSSSVEVNVKRRRASDWFKQLADGLSFEAVNAKTPISGAINVPYVIVKENQVELLIMLSISTYTITKELIVAAKELQTAIADLVQAFTPDAPPSLKIGDIAALAIRVAAQAVYVALLIVTLINLISQIVQILFPPVRNFKGNTYRSLITQALQHPNINLQFSSSLFELDSTFVGVPLIKEKKSIFAFLMASMNQAFNKPYPTASDGQFATLGGMIDFVCEWLNAEYRVINGVLYIEQEAFFASQSGVQFISTLNDQDKREVEWSYNMDEAWKRYYLHYSYDLADAHTLDNTEGVSTEYQTDPLNVNNADLVLIKGLYEGAWPTSLGSRKTELNFVEREVYKLAKLADSVVNFLGGNSSLSSQVLSRIGKLQISSQLFTVPKTLWCVGGVQPPDYLDKIGARAIYLRRHAVNEVAYNFQKIEAMSIPFAPDQFLALLSNNFMTDQDGNEVKILTFEWINDARQADVTISTRSDLGDNTQTTWIN